MRKVARHSFDLSRWRSFKRQLVSWTTTCVVFCVSFIVAFFAASLFTPTNPSDATSDSTDTTVKLNIASVLSLTTSTSQVDIPADANIFVSRPLTVTADTNNLSGYRLTMSDKDANTSLIHQTLPSVAVPNLTSPTTKLSFPIGHWGYSLDDNNYHEIPLPSAPHTIKQTTSPAHIDNTLVNFGTKISGSQAAGTYHDTVVFTAIANYVPTTHTFSGITTMQQMTTEICNAETKPTKEATQSTTDHTEDNNLVPETTLTDTRDGKSYIIRKLADGNCWMSQNLALSPDGDTMYTEADTDLHNGRTFTAPAKGEDDNEWSPDGSDGPGYTIPYPDIAYIQNGNTPSSTGQPLEATGNFYNWPMATAGARDVNGNNLIHANSGEAADSICPKGWRLPPADGDKSYKNLLVSSYNLSTASDGALLLNSPFNFLLASYCLGPLNNDSNDYHFQGQIGALVSSTVLPGRTGFSASTIFQESNFDYDWDAFYGYGLSVRCVAR